jgi:hypothetical protein
MLEELPKISDAVRTLMPDASKEEFVEATVHLRGYLKEFYDIVMAKRVDGDIQDIFTPEE